MGPYPGPIHACDNEPRKIVRRTHNYLEDGLNLYRIRRYDEDGFSSEEEPIYVLAKSEPHAFSIVVDHLKENDMKTRWNPNFASDFQKSVKGIEKVAASMVLSE